MVYEHMKQKLYQKEKRVSFWENYRVVANNDNLEFFTDINMEHHV
ncbi:MAG: hypothetical protein ACMXYK_01700 [Candidatus Woesearchaeota archaeon]